MACLKAFAKVVLHLTPSVLHQVVIARSLALDPVEAYFCQHALEGVKTESKSQMGQDAGLIPEWSGQI